MKLTIASIIFPAIMLFLFFVSSPPLDIKTTLLRFIIIFTIIILLLASFMLPLINGRFSEKWKLTLKLAVFISACAYVLGYITFSLSTLI